MKTNQRDANRRRLLRGIVERRKPELLQTVDSMGGGPVGDASREDLLDVLVEELTDAGLDSSDEPTGYGLVVEDLIDWVRTV